MIRLKFKKNLSYQDGRYDLISGNSVLSWIRLTTPVNEVYKKNGAEFILESWDQGKKVFFTGLRKDKKGIYHGDYYNPVDRIKYNVRAAISNDMNRITLELKKRGSSTSGRSSFKKV